MPSLTLPSGRVTLIGSSGSAAFSAARLAFAASKTCAKIPPGDESVARLPRVRCAPGAVQSQDGVG